MYVHYILLTLFSFFTNTELFFRNCCTSILSSLFLLFFSASRCTCRFCSVWCWSLWLCLCLSCFTHLFLSKWRYSLSLCINCLSGSALAWSTYSFFIWFIPPSALFCVSPEVPILWLYLVNSMPGAKCKYSDVPSCLEKTMSAITYTAIGEQGH